MSLDDRDSAFVMAHAIIANATSVASDISVHCSSSSVGMPRPLSAAGNQEGIRRIGAQPMSCVKAVTANRQRPTTSLFA